MGCTLITKAPTPYPTPYPTTYPTPYPTAYPTSQPTTCPTPYPTAYPTSMPTPAPTPAPTTAPTPAPTALCPVDCKRDEEKFFPVHPCKASDAYQNSMRTVKGRPTCGQKIKMHHIKTTHYSRMQNEFDTFTKHRCYMFSNQCVCECVDAPEYADHT